MNLPQEQSPNWYWQQLGYEIERTPKKYGSGNHRVIRRPDGSVVDTGDGSHEDELVAARKETTARSCPKATEGRIAAVREPSQ